MQTARKEESLMGRYIGPWVKLDRKFGAVISGKRSAPRILQRRNYPPGQHGRMRGRRRKLSEYGLRLLERRLDNVVYRLGFASTRRQARQFVVHGHIFVNGRRVDVPGYEVEEGDIVEIAPSSRDVPVIKDNLENIDPRSVPEWLELDKANFRGKVVKLPTAVGEYLEVPVNLQYIIEFYSKV